MRTEPLPPSAHMIPQRRACKSPPALEGKVIMKKSIPLLLCVCLLLCLCLPLAGCHVPRDPQATTVSVPTRPPLPENIRMPTNDPDFWELLCENSHMIFYLGNSGSNTILFDLISARNLTGEPFCLTTDTGAKVEDRFLEAEGMPMNYFTLAAYQGVSWADIAAEEEPGTFHPELELWFNAREQLQPELPTLYRYVLGFTFEELGLNLESPEQAQQVRTITATVSGKSKTYDLGELIFQPGKYDVNDTYLGGLSTVEFGANHYGVSPSRDGIMELPKLRYKAEKDVTLQGIRVIDCEDIEVVQCQIAVHGADGRMYNMQWDGKSPVDIDEGSTLEMKVTVRDPAMAGKLIGNTMRYFVLDYTRDGESYGAIYQLQSHIFAYYDSIYALKVDGVDMMPFYEDYFNPPQEEN